jgi:hypothetical protein
LHHSAVGTRLNRKRGFGCGDALPGVLPSVAIGEDPRIDGRNATASADTASDSEIKNEFGGGISLINAEQKQ